MTSTLLFIPAARFIAAKQAVVAVVSPRHRTGTICAYVCSLVQRLSRKNKEAQVAQIPVPPPPKRWERVSVGHVTAPVFKNIHQFPLGDVLEAGVSSPGRTHHDDLGAGCRIDGRNPDMRPTARNSNRISSGRMLPLRTVTVDACSLAPLALTFGERAMRQRPGLTLPAIRCSSFARRP